MTRPPDPPAGDARSPVPVADHAVDLQLPASHEFLQIARIVASSVAAQLDFDVEDIEDLRIGVDECCVAALACADPHDTLRLHYEWGPATVRVSGSVATTPLVGGAVTPGDPVQQSVACREPVIEARASGDVVLEDLTAQILATVLDGYRIGIEGDRVVFELRKDRASAEP